MYDVQQDVKRAPRIVAPQILELVQILYQNREIDSGERNKIISLLKESMNTGEMRGLHNHFLTLSFFVRDKKTIQECIDLTEY